MATDIAEVIGAALGLYLLFGIPLFWAGLIAGAGSFAILALQQRGVRKLEAVIIGFVGIVIAAFVFEVTQSNPDPKGIAEGLFIPGFDGTESVLLAVGILGATVMPHVVYLHSALTQSRVVGRNDAERKKILKFEKVDVIIAMTLAGLVNMSMVDRRRRALQRRRAGRHRLDRGRLRRPAADGLRQRGDDLRHRPARLGARLDVGRHDGRPGRHAGLHRAADPTRRCVARSRSTPALIVLAIGVDPTRALVVSQVVLSFGIPFALIPLLIIASRRRVMGAMVNPRWLTGLRLGPRGDDHRPQPLPAPAALLRLTAGAVGESRLSPWHFRSRSRRSSMRCRATGPTCRSICGSRDETRYVDASIPMTQINAQPYSEADWHWRINVAHGFGHGASPETVAWVLEMLDRQGIEGELIVRDLNEGRAEVVQMWGRPESVRAEYRRRRSI